MDNKKLTMREAILLELAGQWEVEFEGIYTIENLKKSIENAILYETKEMVAEKNGISIEMVEISDIAQEDYLAILDTLEYKSLKVNDIASQVVEEYSQFEFSNVYTLLHKIISTSNDFLVKPSPGYFEINIERLTLPGVKKKLDNFVEMQKFTDALENTHKQLYALIDLIKNNKTEFDLTDLDKGLLEKELGLISEAMNCMTVYRINKK